MRCPNRVISTTDRPAKDFGGLGPRIAVFSNSKPRIGDEKVATDRTRFAVYALKYFRRTPRYICATNRSRANRRVITITDI